MGTKLVRCTIFKLCKHVGLKKGASSAEKQNMEANIESGKAHCNRTVPVEQWPESLEILRHLATQTRPRSIKEVAHDVGAPEISTRNRLARLEALGAVVASRQTARLGPARQVTCAHFVITQYGKDCAGLREQNTVRLCVNSVFALASAMKLAG